MECWWHYVRIYTQQSIIVTRPLACENLKAFALLSILLMAAKANTNSCQARILVNFTNVAPAHSSIQYRRNFWYHLIEETHVWKFPENILKYLYGGTLKKCKLFIETHCRNKFWINERNSFDNATVFWITFQICFIGLHHCSFESYPHCCTYTTIWHITEETEIWILCKICCDFKVACW